MTDEELMGLALSLAAKGRGATSPNPMVGAVLVRNDQIVGRGFHARAGEPHAEVVAIEAAGEAACGSTLYCTLEPCCHRGRTGPCVERILTAGVKAVVLGVEDPDPRVDGGGIRHLRERGVAVQVGVCRMKAQRLNEAFFTVKRRARPFVTLKAAVSLDGRIAAGPGRRTQLTGQLALGHAHSVRAEVDAIGVGSETVLVDDPLLTARGVERRRPLVRVLFDTRMRTPSTARVFTTLEAGPVVVMTTEAASATWPDRADALQQVGAIVESLPAREPARAISRLLAYDVSEVLLEGGGQLHQAVWEAGVVDRVRLYIAPVTLGSTGVPWVSSSRLSIAALGGGRSRYLGPDLLLEADVQRFD